MGKNNDRLTIESINKACKEYVDLRWKECLEKGLKIRLVIDFNQGLVSSIQDQAIIIGSTVIQHYTDKLTRD